MCSAKQTEFPVSLSLPTIDFAIVSPLLLGELQCSWTQQPDYRLDQAQLRTSLYDYAYLRKTGRQEALERAKAVHDQQKALG